MEIVKLLETKFHTKILLRNDAKCAAIAEKKIGSLKKFDDAIFLTLGTGIGGAVFMNGEMLNAKKRNDFEIGHMVIDLNGEKCNCGRNGCFETLASMRKLKEDIIEKLNLNSQATGKEIRQLLENKDTYSLINIFKPEAISIGGSFVHYKKLLLDKLKDELKSKKLIFIKNDLPKIVMATLKNEAGIIGATIENL